MGHVVQLLLQTLVYMVVLRPVAWLVALWQRNQLAGHLH